MEIKINIEKRHFFVLLGVVLLFGIVVYVKAVAVDTSVFHGIDQIDWSQMLPRLGVEGSVGIGTNDPTESGRVNSKFTIRPNTATGLAIMRSDGERAFALNPNADGSWTAYDGVSGWVPGITQTGGNVGIGTTAPREQLEVGGNIIFNGVKLTHITGSNPSCPSGSNFFMKKFVGITCLPAATNFCTSSCTVPGGWGVSGECNYASWATASSCAPAVCSSTWTEAVCLGNA